MNNNHLVQPFQALTPIPEYAQEVIAPPYDVLNVEEAKLLAANKPHSFLRISRAELELDDSQDPYSSAVYQRAADNLSALRDKGILIQDSLPSYYIYRISNNSHMQTGIAVAASIDAYKANKIKKHELTRTSKEKDRINQISTTLAQSGPVMLVNRHYPELSSLLSNIAKEKSPRIEAEIDGWNHQIWPVSEQPTIEKCSYLINSLDSLYIADGHHRSAAAKYVYENQAGTSSGFLAVVFDERELNILDYNRIMRDLNNLKPEDFLTKLSKCFKIEKETQEVRPTERHCYGLYLNASWYKLSLRPKILSDDIIERLDVSVIQNLVLESILGIKDIRTDPRIDFVGGSRGSQGVSKRVDSGEMAAGIMLPATSITDLMTIADEEKIMPPKSTWFEPKLADGLLTLLI
tara:strand:+ start:96 stop:1313 length:1218 start_codon:yes stop_codon:yes gene_type:complete